MALGIAATAAPAQTPPPQDGEAKGSELTEIVVTGSRIVRVDTETVQPERVISAQDIEDRGFTNLADIINQLPDTGAGVTPIGGQATFGVGRNYIDLFGLGSNRTLTLVNGYRFVGDNPNNGQANTPGNQVNLNVLPTMFVESINTIAATGAAVYGSDAISGVVNVILKKKFEGVEVSGQTGISTYGDDHHDTFEIAAGRSFLEDRLNLAIDFQYDQTASLKSVDRPWTNAQYSFVSNPGPGPAQFIVPNGRWSGSTPGGLPFQLDGQTSIYLPGTNTIAQFNNSGNLVPYNPGNLFGGPLIGSTAEGGDGLNYAPISPLQTPLKRRVVTAMMNYDITDHLHLNGNVFYSNNVGTEPINGPNFSFIVFGTAAGYNNPLANQALLISSQNAFLTPQARAILAANANVAGAGGVSDFYLSRSNTDISPNPISAPVTTVNSTFNLSGDFDALHRNFTWNAAFTDGYSQSEFHTYNLVTGSQAGSSVPDLFGWALDSIVGPNGAPECRITANNPGSTNPYIKNCQPFNPFGVGNNSAAVLNYITADIANSARNEQKDAQFNIGTAMGQLPAGDAKVTLGYERRYEDATFSPSQASALGIGYYLPQSYQTGSYGTNEIYAETLIPVFGRDFRFPFAERLQFEGAYRSVRNSIAGNNKSWSFGGEYVPMRGITFRGSRSRTFRAPALTELFAAHSNGFDQGTDPCQLSNLTAGPNPAARQANCQKAFAALGADLSTFTTSYIEDFTHPITTGGNASLKNEIGNSWTYGVVLEPRQVPGLSLSADYVEINIKDAIEYFNVASSMEACYDSPAYPDAACSLFTRDHTGQILSAEETYVNEGYNRFAAITYALHYDRALNELFDSGRRLGRVGWNLSAIDIRHNINSTSGLGYDAIESAGTIFNSKWRVNSTFSYQLQPVKLAWTTHYFSPVRWDLTYTSANIAPLVIGRSVTHDFSASYDVTANVAVHFNMNNVFNQGPPYPPGGYVYQYYDFVGRYFLLSVRAKF